MRPLAILFLLLAAACRQAPPAHVVVVSVDGLRPEFYEGGWDAPNLEALARDGLRARSVEGIYPSVTYPSHATIVTGVTPDRHGIYSNTKMGERGRTPFWFWEEKDIEAETLWQKARAGGRTVAIIYWPSSVGADVDWLIPERWALFSDETTADLMKKMATPGLLDEIHSEVTELTEKERKDYGNIDRYTAAAAALVLRRHKPGLMFVHLIEVDHEQHLGGRDTEGVRASLKRIDAHIGRLREAAPRETVFVIVGDHGFRDVKKTVNPNRLFLDEGLVTYEKGKVVSWKAIAHASGGQAAVYAKDDESAKRAMALLRKQPEYGKLFRILDRAELDRLGSHPKQAFAIAGLADGAISGSFRSNFIVRGRKQKGNHGSHPSIPELHTGFIVSGPGIKAGVIEKMKLVDIAPRLSKLMGLD